MRSLCTLLLACLLLTLAAGTATASLTVRLSLSELSDASVAIVRGKVVAIDAAWDPAGEAIYSYVVIRVAEALKGDVPKRITVKQLGGTVDDMALRIEGQAEFRRGEEVVLFLGVRERDRTLQTSTLWQGKWTVGRDRDARLAQAVRHAGRDAAGRILEREQVELADLEAAARVRSTTSRSIPAGIVFDPPEAPRPGSTGQRRLPTRSATLGHSWHQAFSRSRIPVSFTDTHQPGLFIGNGKGAVKIAWHFWDNVPGAINFLTNGHKYTGAADGTEIRDGSCTGDIAVFNQDPNGEIDNEGGAIAIGGAYFDTSKKIRGLSEACNGFVVGNDSDLANRYMDYFVCYENILIHEMGHAVGLSHVDNPAALMAASITEPRCDFPFFLHAEERDALREIYSRDYLQ